MDTSVKPFVFALEFALLPAGVKRIEEKFERILNSGFLRASYEYRPESRSYLVKCSAQHEKGVCQLFLELLREVIEKEVGMHDLSDNKEIDSRFVARVWHDDNNVEIPRDFIDKEDEWPPAIKPFDFKSVWVYPSKHNAPIRAIPEYRQNALKLLTRTELVEDSDSPCIYVGADSQNDLLNTLKRLDRLKKQVDSFKHGDSHVFYTEHRDNFQVSVRPIPSVKKRLEYTTLLDPVYNNGAADESYHALALACTIRCCPFDRIRNTFILKSGEKLFSLVTVEAKEKTFYPWKNYVYTRKSDSSLRPNSSPPLIDFMEEREIPRLKSSEKTRNVASWLFKDLPVSTTNTTLQMIHDVCYRDKDATKFGDDVNFSGNKVAKKHVSPITSNTNFVQTPTTSQANPPVSKSDRKDTDLLGLSPASDMRWPIQPGEGQEPHLASGSPDKSFDLFSSLMDSEGDGLIWRSPEHQANVQGSLFLKRAQDTSKICAQKPLDLERDLVQAKEYFLPRDGAGERLITASPDYAVETQFSLLDGDTDNIPQLSTQEASSQSLSEIETGPQPSQKGTKVKRLEELARQFHKSMNQSKGSDTSFEASFRKPSQSSPVAVDLRPSENFQKGIVDGMKPVIANMRWWQGEVTLEAQLGRIIITGIASRMIDEAGKTSSPPEQVSRVLTNNPDTIEFTKLLSTLPADAQFVLEMKGDAGGQLWGPEVRKSVTYEFTCYVPGSESFVVEMDGESFRTRVRSLPSKLGCIYVHGTLRNLDYRIIALGTRSLESEHGIIAKAIADNISIDMIQDRVALGFRLPPGLKIVIDSIRVCHRSHHISFDGRSALNINEVHDLDVDLAEGSEWTFYRARSPDSMIQPLWYEMSISSTAAEKILEENMTVELGEQAAWTEEALIRKATTLTDLCLPGNYLVKKLDGLGFYNQNCNQFKKLLYDTDDAPRKTESDTQLQPVYW